MPEKPQFAEVQYGFDVRSAAPVDRRLVLTKKEMRDLEVTWNCKKLSLEAIMPTVYFALCKDNGRLYKYCDYDYECDCISEEEKIYPYWIGDKFKLVDRVVDVGTSAVNSEGKEEFHSVLDKHGIARVATAAQLAEVKAFIDSRMEDVDAKLALKADKTQIEELEEEIETKQKKFVLLGDGDKLDSEGNIVPATDDGVHVTLKKDAVLDKGELKDKFTITHESIVGGSGWTSLFACGGVPANRFFPPSTTIKEIVRLMLVGDPMFDNAIYYGALTTAPADMTDVIGKLTFGTALEGHDLYEEMVTTGWTWNSAIDCYKQYPVIVIPSRLWNGQNDPQQEVPTRKELKLSDVYLCDTDGKVISGAEVPMETAILHYKDKEGTDEGDFKVYMLGWKNRIPVTQSGAIKFKYVFEEV